MSSPETISPFNSVPPIIVALCVVFLGVELAFSLGAQGYFGGPEAIGWRIGAQRQYGFSGVQFDWMLQNQRFSSEILIRFVTYPFIHANFTHTIFGCVLFLAMGKWVGEIYSTFATAAVLVVSSIVGAVAYGLLLNSPILLIGAFPAIYGLIGAFTYMLWMRLGQEGAPQLRAFSLIGFLLFIRILFGALFGSEPDWVADLAGFVAGFGLSFFVSPGGWSAFLRRIRQQR